MSLAEVRNILHIPGHLCINPTDISDSTEFPYGGTALGVTREAEMRFGIKTSLVYAEEFGTPVEAVYTGDTALFAFVIRDLDNDALATVFPNTATGSTSGDKVIEGRVSGVSENRAGYTMSSQSVKLLFAPRVENTDPSSTTYIPFDEQPMVLIPKAVPLVEETSMLQLSIKAEIGVGVVFQAIPDSSGRLYDVGKRGDITL